MKDFVILQEQNFNDSVACYNALFCKAQGLSYQPYEYFMSVLLLDIVKPHFKHVIQIDRGEILTHFDRDGLLLHTKRGIYFGEKITLLKTCEDYMNGGRGILPKHMIVLANPPSTELNLSISQKRFFSKDCEIVVARYNESVDWLRCFHPSMIRLYNKGLELESIPNTPLPNVGREAHTYLHHIVQNYHKLSPYVMFTQAGITNNEGCLTNPFEFVTELMESCIYNLGISRNYLRYDHVYPTTYDMRESKECGSSSMVFGAWFEKFVNRSFETNPKWFKGAIMCLSRSVIRSRERSYYKRLLETVSYHINPEEAYYLERSWYYVFQKRRVFHCFGVTKGSKVAVRTVAAMFEFVNVFILLDVDESFEQMSLHMKPYLSKIYLIKNRERLDHEVTHYHVLKTELDRVFEPDNNDIVIMSTDSYHPNNSDLKRKLAKKNDYVCRMEQQCFLIPYTVLAMHDISDIMR